MAFNRDAKPLAHDSAITTDGWHPVPGIEAVVAAANTARDKPIAFVESLLVDWQADGDEHREMVGHLFLPADKAYTFGFIDAAERTRLMGDARVATVRSMQEVLDTLRPGKEQYRYLLQSAAEVGNSREFRRIAAKARLKFTVNRPVWRWPYGSIAGEVLKGTDAQAAGSYWLISPPRTGRRRILPRTGSGKGDRRRGGCSWRARCGRCVL